MWTYEKKSAHQIFNISKDIRTQCFSCCNELPSHHQVAVDMDRAAKSWGFQRRFLRKGFRASKLENGDLSSVGLSQVSGWKKITLKKGVYISTTQEGYPWIIKSFLDYQKPLLEAIPFYRLSLRSHSSGEPPPFLFHFLGVSKVSFVQKRMFVLL